MVRLLGAQGFGKFSPTERAIELPNEVYHGDG
jgi:hypothetical protein